MTGVLHDLRYALRQLRRSPGFAAVAIITLALGIGANTAIFSLINAIMLRTLPVRDPQNLVMLTWSARKAPDVHSEWEQNGCPREMSLPQGCSFSYPMFQQIQTRQNVFSGIYALVPLNLTFNFKGLTSHVGGLFVSGDFFSVLGTHPLFGRLLGPADDSSSAPLAMVVSYRFWRTVLGADPGIVGKRILAGAAPVTVVGVAMPGFLDLDPGYSTDFWLPLSIQPAVAPYFPKRNVGSLWLEIMGRVKPGLETTRASAAVNAIFSADVSSGPEAIFKSADLPRIELRTAAQGFVTLRQRFSGSLFSLLLAVGLVLTMACANIAGLTLARSVARRKEIALRATLGASRARILRQFITESVLLSAVGGGTAIVLGYWGAKFLSANWQTPLRVSVRPDLHVLCFTLVLSVLTGLVFGLIPALSTGQVELVPALKETDGGRSPRSSVATIGDTLVVVQMAIAMLILVGAGLLVRTFANLRAENVGFDPKNLLVFSLDTTYSSRASGNLELLNHDLKEQLAALPGVISATYSEITFLTGGGITTDALASTPNSSGQNHIIVTTKEGSKDVGNVIQCEVAGKKCRCVNSSV